jgi:hypothetical protein
MAWASLGRMGAVYGTKARLSFGKFGRGGRPDDENAARPLIVIPDRYVGGWEEESEELWAWG